MITRILTRYMDERTLTHRLRSTSTAGIATAILAVAGFEYRLLAQHLWDLELLSVALAFVTIKLSLMLWYRFQG